MVVVAKKKDDSPYLKGAVPMENGIVKFTKTFKVKNMTDAQLHSAMLQYVKDSLVNKGIQDAYGRMLSDDNSNEIIARVEEWMVFKKMFLYLDETRLRYQIDVKTEKGRVNISISQISYLYGEDIVENKPTGKGGERYCAEEWISDSCALNKAGTALLPMSAKFRRKTVDRMNEIFDKAMDMCEVKVKQQAETSKPKEVKNKRKFVED